MNIIRPTPDGAYVYHDGFKIHGISFVPDEDFAQRCDHVRIPNECAIDFIHGKLDIQSWFVWPDPAGIVLYNSKNQSISTTFIDEEYIKIPNHDVREWLTIKVYPTAGRIIFHLKDEINLACDDTKTVSFMLTECGDPSAVLWAVNVPVWRLFAHEMIDLEMPVLDRFDIWTRRLFPGYVVKVCTTDTHLVLPLPHGHFSDLVRFERSVKTRGLQAVRKGSTLSFRLLGNIVEMYDREMESIKLIFSMPNDPTLPLHMMSVPILRDLDMTFTVSLPPILDQPFDIWSPLLYPQVSLVEHA